MSVSRIIVKEVAKMSDPTTAVAAGALTSPIWLPSLNMVSAFFATVLPILGAIWLIVQIVRAIYTWPSKS
ncbi:hypothetical protein GCM10007385_35650 [Tateyamaria omphalii]|uniref:hypothetical protein n=1 Tax=Tateyamaria omphalii TaxID=299262 RepID=UPI00167C11F9|nr:hypothetical protein [Tateyamaria omphalii]GGX63383.1 hypothetical protein GCM10007385_35650 [Tateyamaria omphalii]